MGMILLLWWLTGFQRWHILFLARGLVICSCSRVIFQRSGETTWSTKEYSFRSRYQICWVYFQHTLWKKLKIDLEFNSLHHPQNNGQIEVMNYSFGNLLRCFLGDKTKGYDMILPQEKFSYKNSINRSIGKSPFQIVYGSSHKNDFELRKLDT